MSKKDVPKFKYQYTHDKFKTTLLEIYSPLDRVGFRNVSQACTMDDFIPEVTEVINPEKKVTKEHIDRRSLSFHTNPDACHNQAVNAYSYRNRRYGFEEAEKWKSKHTHIAEVPLTKQDGYMEKYPQGFHFNFAPFETFKINKYDMKEVDYNMDEVYFLQVQDNIPIATLWIRQDNNQCFLCVKNENAAHLPLRCEVEAKDIVNYMRKRATLKSILKGRGHIIIKSQLEMYEHYDKNLVYNEEVIVDRLFSIVKNSEKFTDKLFHHFSFKYPLL